MRVYFGQKITAYCPHSMIRFAVFISIGWFVCAFFAGCASAPPTASDKVRMAKIEQTINHLGH